MNNGKALIIRISPEIRGVEEIETTLAKLSDSLLYAQDLLEKVKAMTVEVTAFTEANDATDSQ